MLEVKTLEKPDERRDFPRGHIEAVHLSDLDFAAATLEPGARIDYIHVGPPGERGLGHVRSVHRACDTPIAGIWPSDHAAVTADLAD